MCHISNQTNIFANFQDNFPQDQDNADHTTSGKKNLTEHCTRKNSSLSYLINASAQWVPFVRIWQILQPFLRGAARHPKEALFQKGFSFLNMAASYDSISLDHPFQQCAVP
jgi:hypothetical protein